MQLKCTELKMAFLEQCAALPYIKTEWGLLVLLVTTRGTGRWTIPKGWPKAGLSNHELAAREAFEEAGAAGEISSRLVGTFIYTKRLHLFSWVRCRVKVYPLHVDRQYISWPEKSSRKLMWVEPGNAASLVGERQLADLLREFDCSTQSTA